jgi:hypothetical protein
MKPPAGIANAERPAGDKPAPAPERIDPHAGYWAGSASGQVALHRFRAEQAEAALRRLMERLKNWRIAT